MSSPSSSEDPSTPVENPSTPQNNNLDLPPRQQIRRSASPTTSIIAAAGSSFLLSSSMTPPPSSQAPNPRPANTTARQSTTPEPSILSSPPPTMVNGVRRETTNGALTKPTTEEIANASIEELREMLQGALTENSKLDVAAREARMSAAHYKLQHNLLTIESEEAVKHLEVEHDMTLREVELLQLRVRDAQEPPELDVLRTRCMKLEEDRRKVYEQLRRAKKLLVSQCDDISSLETDNQQLRERIVQNRKHINELRSPGGPLHISSLQNSPTTPHQYHRSTPKHTPMTNRSIRHGRDHSQEPFAALLLADRVLSQENNSAPSTPIVSRRPDPRTPNRHNRGVQSLSSLPTTPRSVRPLTSTSTLLPSAQFSPEAEARVANNLSHVVQQSRERRRKSRDSTISASDAEEIARAAGRYREESQEIPESQASQSATEMLRLDPRESFEVAASRTNTPTPVLQQSKIFGSVTKPAPQKRKRSDEFNSEFAAKKARAGASGIGLGIGFENRTLA